MLPGLRAQPSKLRLKDVNGGVSVLYGPRTVELMIGTVRNPVTNEKFSHPFTLQPSLDVGKFGASCVYAVARATLGFEIQPYSTTTCTIKLSGPSDISTDDVPQLAQARLPLKSVDYGDPFRIELGRMQIKPDILNVIENRCVSYLASLLKGLLRILPEQSGRFSAMKHLMPGVCLKPYGQRPRFQSLPLSLAAKETDMTVLQQQWDRMANVDWGQYFDGSVPTSSVELWTALFKYEIGGERRFAVIAAFALRVLTTLLSNATVERAFSVMNLTKTKIRNRMQTKMLEALLRLRLWSHGRHCCAAFEPSAAMYALFNREMYDDDQVGGADGTEAGAADEMIDEIIVMISGDEEIL
ncbi:Cullin-associated NEDD8-dissociated protein 1, N-terminal part [Frankliniella fusca]|uniref:Cullin-associated NEDD8-dissociated protein 1, N-terminal part n=1 Tax=Frankliniella fusca TaxID=407009 RepID=A0AAE1LVF7_9NEOP|nr:Cullin-associated NEDD8-dissociated protein 1, N-terminal part [Frankliniella fusca]